MNINFHYFAVYAIARTAGFDAIQGQLLAEFSQFVDDYTTGGDIVLDEPDTAGAGYLAADKLGLIEHKSGVHTVKSVQTGFAGLDYLWSLASRFQNNTIVPFHFIPFVQLSNTNYSTTTRPANLGDESVISRALADAIEECKKNNYSDRCLVALGVLLHIFADTYAHQRFNGHWDGVFHGSVNCYTVQQVWENTAYGTKGADVTDEYDSNFFKLLPAVGHATAGHAPDDTNITMRLSVNRGAYERNNTDAFAEAAREIYWMLHMCASGSAPEEDNWQSLKQRLLSGFLVKNAEKFNETMLHAWHRAFNGEIGFAYSDFHVRRKMFPDIQAVEFEDGSTINAAGLDDSNVHRALLEADSPVKSMTAKVTDMFFWFTIAANDIRRKAVAEELLR